MMTIRGNHLEKSAVQRVALALGRTWACQARAGARFAFAMAAMVGAKVDSCHGFRVESSKPC